jgi:methionine synthase II (cobalamin-independent)
MEISIQQTLDIETKKIQLIQMISPVYNSEILHEIETILLSSKMDWWNIISNSEKKAIEEGLEDYKNGKLLSNEEVSSRIKSRLKRAC